MAACTSSWVNCFTARDNRVVRSHTVQKVPYSKDPDAVAVEAVEAVEAEANTAKKSLSQKEKQQ